MNFNHMEKNEKGKLKPVSFKIRSMSGNNASKNSFMFSLSRSI